MRVLIIGGTRFIGRRITERLVARGDEVLVVHRGLGEPVDWVRCEHAHVPRRDFFRIADQVGEFRPDVVVDTVAMTRADAEAVLPYLPDVPTVVLSSMDVYRAYELALAGSGGIPVPMDEESPQRQERYPHRGAPGIEGYDFDMDSYDKLDVEPLFLERGGTVLRLGMVYGEHDPQQREEFVLRRVRAGRRAIPSGVANWLWTRIHVDDAANAVIAALDSQHARGEVFNIGETTTATMRTWIEQILATADHSAELVQVPPDRLPADLVMTGSFTQHMLFSSDKARRILGWQPQDAAERVRQSVQWHLANHSSAGEGDFSADDAALGR